MKGMIFDMQRCSLDDGPGIRTTVFLKGCPLKCRWCHNPESQSHRPELLFVRDKCAGCGACVSACPHQAHLLDNSQHALDRSRCGACGACAAACRAGALRIAGYEQNVDAIMDEIERDRPYYENSGGGMTLSGGEPLAQPAFAEALLRECAKRRIHTCVETCGHVPPEVLRQIMDCVDLCLFDYKEADPQRHRAATGVDNLLILENLERLVTAGASVVLRCPLIPGVNDSDDHLAGIAALARRLSGIRSVQIMPYHSMGGHKREDLGRPDDGFRAPEPDETVSRRWLEVLESYGCSVAAT